MQLISKTLDESGQTERIVRTGLFYSIVFVGGFLVWASVVPIAGALIAEGVVEQDAKGVEIKSPAKGFIRQVLAENGRHVDAGQSLLMLEWTDPKGEARRLAAEIGWLKLRIARFDAELAMAPTFEIPSDIQPNDPRLHALYQEELLLFNARRAGYLESIRAEESQGGPIDMARTESSLRHAYQADAIREVGGLRRDIVRLEKRAARVVGTSALEPVQATYGGKIRTLRRLSEGVLIMAGEPLVEVIPDRPEKIVMARIRAKDIASVYVGQAVDVQIMVGGGKIAGSLKGVVDEVPTMPVSHSLTAGAVPYYEVRIRAKEHPEHWMDNPSIAVAAPVLLFMETRGRTFLEMIFRPLEDTLVRGLRQD